MVRFDYHMPKTIEEAIKLFYSLDKPRYIAGGTDVIVNVKRKKLTPKNLISLRGISDLRVFEQKDGLVIGSMVTHEEILRNEVIRRDYTALHDAVSRLGSKQIRNVATIGGNICNAAPSADTACPLLVLDAVISLYGLNGVRKINIDDFFLGPGRVAKEDGEILTRFEIPSFPKYTGSAYIKHSRREAMDLAIVSLATRVTFSFQNEKNLGSDLEIEELRDSLDALGIMINDIRIAMGVVAPRPKRAKRAEDYLRGKVLTLEALNEASEIASSEAEPRDTIRGEAWYRREMVRVLTRRAILLSLKRALPREHF